MQVTLVSGLFGEYVSADCYIDGEYYDFITSNKGVRLINQFGEDVQMSLQDYVFIEEELRRQHNKAIKL